MRLTYERFDGHDQVHRSITDEDTGQVVGDNALYHLCFARLTLSHGQNHLIASGSILPMAYCLRHMLMRFSIAVSFRLQITEKCWYRSRFAMT
jgi:hypothetical protein